MNDALLKFQKTVCPEIPLDSEELTHRLIIAINEEISKLKEENGS